MSHPGPTRATLPAAIRDAVVAHARAELPNEACGLIAGPSPVAEGGVATSWHPTRNRAASPARYDVDPADLLRVSLEIDDAGAVIWAIVHSHVRAPAVPSPTDLARAFYPDALYLIVSVGAGATPAGATGVDAPGSRLPDDGLRAWRIVDGLAFEVVLETSPGR